MNIVKKKCLHFFSNLFFCKSIIAILTGILLTGTFSFANSVHYTLFRNRNHYNKVIDFKITQYGKTIASGSVWPNSERMVIYTADSSTTPLELYFRYKGDAQWISRSWLGMQRANSVEEARKNPYQISHTDL